MSLGPRWELVGQVMVHYPHDDPPSLPPDSEALPRYAVVQRFFQKDVDDDPDAYWYDFGDEPQEVVDACVRDRDQSGFVPFLVVDLDSGHTQAVANGVIVDLDPDGPPTYTPPPVPPAAPLGPRGRLSPLADPAQPPAADPLAANPTTDKEIDR